MDLGLAGKRILVTGGSKGIGRVICATFLAEGARVEFCARNTEQVAQTAKELQHLGDVVGTSVDVSNGDAMQAWVADGAARLGGLDYVVANASAFAIGATPETWQQGFDVDILGTQYLLDAALPHLLQAARVSGDAAAILIASTSAAEAAFPNAYGAVKAALIHLAKGIARQQASNKVRCNTVSPGTVYFPGGVWHTVEQNAPDMFKQTVERNPMGRMATPQEVANAVVFLASPQSSFTTGANLLIDGGITQRVNF